MHNLFVACVLFLACSGLPGCGGDSGSGPASGGSGSANNRNSMEAAAGVYRLDVAAWLEQMRKDVPPELQESATRQFDAIAADMDGSIELQADGTMSFMMRNPPTVDGTFPGTWTLEGTKLTLTRNEGRKTKTQQGTLSDGTITLHMSAGGRSQQMVFHRE